MSTRSTLFILHVSVINHYRCLVASSLSLWCVFVCSAAYTAVPTIVCIAQLAHHLLRNVLFESRLTPCAYSQSRLRDHLPLSQMTPGQPLLKVIEYSCLCGYTSPPVELKVFVWKLKEKLKENSKKKETNGHTEAAPAQQNWGLPLCALDLSGFAEPYSLYQSYPKKSSEIKTSRNLTATQSATSVC